jgi:predicted thioesterase
MSRRKPTLVGMTVRDVQINIRLTVVEGRQLRELGLAMGLSTSDVIRSLITQAHAQLDPEKLRKQLAEEAKTRKKILGGDPP